MPLLGLVVSGLLLRESHVDLKIHHSVTVVRIIVIPAKELDKVPAPVPAPALKMEKWVLLLKSQEMTWSSVGPRMPPSGLFHHLLNVIVFGSFLQVALDP